MDIAGAQHYVECSLCPRNAQYHCNTCKDKLCEECKIKHEKSNASRNHTVVLYQTRDKSAPEVEICKAHPTLTYEMCCQQCEVPVCSRCVKEKHNGHKFIDTEMLYSEKKNILEKDLKEIKNNSLPKFHLLLEDVKDDAEKCQDTISKIRSSMKAKANAIKSVVDDILSEELSYLDALENSILSELERQETTLNNNISHLNNIVDELRVYMKESKLAEIILIQRERKAQRLTEIPTLEKPNLPSFIEGELKRDIIKSLFGKLSLSKTRSEVRNIKMKKGEITYKLGQRVIQVASVPGDMAVTRFGNRILFQIPGSIWVFKSGELTQIDMKGKLTNTFSIENCISSCFTLNGQNELLYLDGNDIQKYTDQTGTEIVMSVQEWKPLAICFSHFNENLIIVGDRDEKTKKYPVVIYDKNKRKVCQGDFDICPGFIVGNINGDICISSNLEVTVEVKDKSLRHRFTYHGGPHFDFRPYSVSTDVVGHILVCNACRQNISVHMLDRDGNFISLLLTQQEHGIKPTCITTDEKHNLLIGDAGKSIKVYKYLEAI